MSASQSNISSEKYGYDFVVATTQASINAGLKEYLHNADQPTTYICFLADKDGNPTKQISLPELKKKTGGINPFEIPKGTDYDDPRIKTLTENMFVVGLKLKMGLPPGILPKDLPPIVNLGTSANNVRFNLLCSEFELIQNSPPSGFGGKGSWNVWSQPNGHAWYFTTKVDLVLSDLDKELDTPYFNNHPAKKKALLNRLKNISASAFSLQQLLFNLDSAVVMSTPTIQGLPSGSDAAIVLTKSFTNIYFKAMKKRGEPVIAVHAAAQTPDHASLRLTGIEREVGPFIDSNGNPVSNPSPDQQKAVTLDYLCAANNNPLPGAATFNWNWVEPSKITDESGAMAINRKTMAKWLYNQLLPQIRSACIRPSTSTSVTWYGKIKVSWSFSPYQTPQSVEYPDTGDTVLKVSYTKKADSSDKSGATYGEFDVHSSYDCTVDFKGNQIIIKQHLVMWTKVQFDSTPASGNVVDKTITDTYTLSVDENGNLQTDRKTSKKDNSKNIDLSGFVNFFVNLNDIIDEVAKTEKKVTEATFHNFPIRDVQNFVFPGADVFTYKDVLFSDGRDLVAAITYVRPD